jgi:hypothetical protein
MSHQLRKPITTLFAALALQLAACESSDGKKDSGAGGSGGVVGGSGGGLGGSGGGTGGSGGGTGGSGGSAGRGGSGGSGGSAGTGGSGGAGGGSGGTGGVAGRDGGGGTGGTTTDASSDRSGTAGTGGTGGRDAGGGAGDGSARPSNPEVDMRCTVPVTFNNTAASTMGGMIFDREIPDAVATMQQIARTVCNILYKQASEVKNVTRQTLIIDMHDGVANAGGGTIRFSANYIASYSASRQPPAINFELHGVLTHESGHVWQNSAGGGGALVEAMADYIRFRGGYDRISRRRPGGNWNSPYTTGGFFIVWIEDKYDKDFGYKVNAGMKNGSFSYPNLVQQVTGKSIDAAWAEYQAEISM